MDIARAVFASAVLAGCLGYACWTLREARRIDGREGSRVDASSSVPATGYSRPSVIYLAHHGEYFECADIWSVIEVARLLAEIDVLPTTEEDA